MPAGDLDWPDPRRVLNSERAILQLRGAIFDCDGVLVLNTNEIYDEAFALTVQTLVPEYSSDEMQAVMQRTRGKTFVHQLRLIVGVDSDLIAKAIQHYEEYIHSADVFKRISPLPGVESLLSDLKNRGLLIALATGMNPSLLSRLFESGVLPRVFDHVANVHDIDDPEMQKPHPKILLDVMNKLNILPSEAAYVGDTKDDIEMASRCDVFSVAVLTGRLDKEQAVRAGANLILSSAVELPKWL